jgi:hypothetical protein
MVSVKRGGEPDRERTDLHFGSDFPCRHSGESRNPVFQARESKWIPAFAGMTS